MTLRSPEQEPHYHMQFSIILSIFLFEWDLTFLLGTVRLLRVSKNRSITIEYIYTMIAIYDLNYLNNDREFAN